MSRQVCGFTLDDGPVLVTGAGGFVGKRLMELFQLGEGDIAADSTAEFSAPAGVRKIQWKLPGAPPASLGKVRYVVHLAGLSSVAHSHADGELVMRINAEGTRSVAEWLQSRSPGARLLFVSSAEVYRPSTCRMTEVSPVDPRSPYGESKLEAEKKLIDTDIDYLIARSFPHFGPGQSGHFVLPSFCRRILRAGGSGQQTISTGNLTAVRDYLYIDDVVRAYACILAEGETGEIYNVCSGAGHSIGELLGLIMDESASGVRAVIDPRLLREEDQFYQIGNPEKLRNLGWTAGMPLEKGLGMLYKWWEERL